MDAPISTMVLVDSSTLMSAQHFARWLKLKSVYEFDSLLELPMGAHQISRQILSRLASLARTATLGEADNDYFGDRRLVPLAEQLEQLSVRPQ